MSQEVEPYDDPVQQYHHRQKLVSGQIHKADLQKEDLGIVLEQSMHYQQIRNMMR